jgi:hypothetical protein
VIADMDAEMVQQFRSAGGAGARIRALRKLRGLRTSRDLAESWVIDFAAGQESQRSAAPASRAYGMCNPAPVNVLIKQFDPG